MPAGGIKGLLGDLLYYNIMIMNQNANQKADNVYPALKLSQRSQKLMEI